MRKSILSIVLMICSSPAFSQNATTTLHVHDYLERFLEGSVDLEAARDGAADALETFETAQLNQQSAYTVGLLRSESIFKHAVLRSTENETVKLAFQRIFSSIASETSYRFAKTAEEIATAIFARSEELAKKEYISARDALLARTVYMQSSTNTRNAKNAGAAALKNLIRPIEVDYTRLEIDPFALSVTMPRLPNSTWAVDHDATVIKHRTDLPLYRERRDFLKSSASFSPAEIEAIEQTIIQTERQLQLRIWTVVDTVEQLQSQIDANGEAIAIAQINIEVETIDLRQAEHSYENGDIYASDVTQAQLALATAGEQLKALMRDRFLLVVEALSLTNTSLLTWAVENLGEE